MADTKFKKGKPKTGGRKKGVKNKITSNIEEMAFKALNDPRIGGEEGFIKWIKTSKRNQELFYSWLMRMLPSNVGVEHSGEIKVPIKLIYENADTNARKN